MEPATVFWIIVSALITLIYVPIIYFQNKYNDKLSAENDELKSEIESLKKELEESTKIINELKKIEQKYNFIRENTPQFNVGDKVGIYSIVGIDVKIPSFVDKIVGFGKQVFNLFFRTDIKTEEINPCFVYEAHTEKDTVAIRFTENQLAEMAKKYKKAKSKTN